jgi:hypothetical protein
MKRILAVIALLGASAVAAPALADTTPPPAPYSLPWQLRPAAVASGLRSDTAVASFKDPDGKATWTVASMFLATYAIIPELSVFARVAVVGTPKGGGLSNPAVGGTYVLKLPADLRLAFFLGLALPLGEGGGDSPPSADVAAAVKSGILARSAMDNAMFAVNDVVIFPGVDLAYVGHGFTAQAELTVLGLVRARGEAVQKDVTKVNLTAGLHAGYFFIPQLSLGAELRYQRWLSTPALVAADATGASRDNLSVAVGPRVHVKIGESSWFRPGLAYARGLDKPMAGAGYNIVQIDLPITF